MIGKLRRTANAVLTRSSKRSARVEPRPTNDRLTIVTPSFERHADQFGHMVDSIVTHCRDLDRVTLIVVVEAVNEATFASLLARHPMLDARIVVTEDVLSDFGIREAPSAFLKRIGKFTFQSIKKFGGLLAVETDWSLVLDSEGLFHAPFDAMQLLDDYRQQKYVFYTETGPRGRRWNASLGKQVTANAAAALDCPAGDRWFMEYFHWFYESEKVRDLILNKLGRRWFEDLADPACGRIDYFENILYYLYLQKYHAAEYDFVDFKQAIDTYLPAHLSRRFDLSALPFSEFGNDFLLNVLSPDDIPALAPLFERYRLAFIRLEPPHFSPRYLEELAKLPFFVATISSHYAYWMRKKIAVCISGEFREQIRNVPEHHVRHLLGFLSGVECDVFIHGWSNPNEALILDVLKPRAWLFEPRRSFSALARRVGMQEPRIKPGRDEGSMSMFYGLQKAFELLEPYLDDYDYVLRIRPDWFSERSLKEILSQISDNGDLVQDAIYFPTAFHAKGVNDQIAIGPIRLMKIHAETLGYIERNAEKLFFNPEAVLLRHLLERGVRIALFDLPYALMREGPFLIGSVFERFHDQFRVWWSRTETLPAFVDVTAYFADKLRAMDAVMRSLPYLLYARGRTADGDTAVIRTIVHDDDPARYSLGLFRRPGWFEIAPFVIGDGVIVRREHVGGKQIFAFPDGDGVTFSEWRMEEGKLLNGRMTCAADDVSATARGVGVRIKLSFYMERRAHKRAAARRDRGRDWLGRLIGR